MSVHQLGKCRGPMAAFVLRGTVMVLEQICPLCGCALVPLLAGGGICIRCSKRSQAEALRMIQQPTPVYEFTEEVRT